MRFSLGLLLIASIILSAGYFYRAVASVCQVPLRYSIGTFDSGFPISVGDAQSALAEAEAVWESATGRDLFIYEEQSTFVVNFIFDERQARTVAEESWLETLDRNEERSAALAEQYEQAKANYDSLQQGYQAKVAAYEKDLATFNAIVAEYNADGGAPREVYEELEKEEERLNDTRDELQDEANELQELVVDLNRLAEEGNKLIRQYNERVEVYNTTFGEPQEFTQGDYQGDHINIYTFKDRNELIRVLVHEFGHALDIGHVEGSQSMMYYLMEDQPEMPVLSEEDRAAFIATCGTGEGIVYTARTLINKLAAKF